MAELGSCARDASGRSSTIEREETRSGFLDRAFLEPMVAKKRVGSEASCEAEPKVIVAEGRIELAAQRNAAHRVRMTPGATTRDAAHAVVGPRGVPLR